MKILGLVAAAVLCSGVVGAQDAAPPPAPPAGEMTPPPPPPPDWQPAPAAPTASAIVVSTPAPVIRREGPPEEMEELRDVLGTWKCEGTLSKTMGGPAQKTASTLEIHPDLRGFWLSGKDVRDKVLNPPGEERLFFWSFDPVMHQYVGGWLNSSGGWSTQTSFGWQNEQLVMFGHVTAEGNRTEGREIFKRPVDGSFTRVYDILNPANNEWTRMAEGTCRAVKAAPKGKRK
jgi:hypothetical protein